MSKRGHFKPTKFLAIIACVCLGIFIGAYISSIDFRASVNGEINKSAPVRFANEQFKNRGFDVCIDLPTRRGYRHQDR